MLTKKIEEHGMNGSWKNTVMIPWIAQQADMQVADFPQRHGQRFISGGKRR
jgi:hypothetical protein